MRLVRKLITCGTSLSLNNDIALLRELQEHPFTGTGKSEPLKYQFSGAWSRRINHKDRLVYQVDGEVVTVFVLAMRYHDTR
ncbi:MAG: Txe/YoeB family addiction module toxin [Bacteroidaceae bacterium]|nr:Txe/YoeB family addiction module toxin [Bacteroidaceae bacterium]